MVSFASWQGENQEDFLGQCASYLITSGSPCAILMNSCTNCKLRDSLGSILVCIPSNKVTHVCLGCCLLSKHMSL